MTYSKQSPPSLQGSQSSRRTSSPALGCCSPHGGHGPAGGRPGGDCAAASGWLSGLAMRSMSVLGVIRLRLLKAIGWHPGETQRSRKSEKNSSNPTLELLCTSVGPGASGSMSTNPFRAYSESTKASATDMDGLQPSTQKIGKGFISDGPEALNTAFLMPTNTVSAKAMQS